MPERVGERVGTRHSQREQRTERTALNTHTRTWTVEGSRAFGGHNQLGATFTAEGTPRTGAEGGLVGHLEETVGNPPSLGSRIVGELSWAESHIFLVLYGKSLSRQIYSTLLGIRL